MCGEGVARNWASSTQTILAMRNGLQVCRIAACPIATQVIQFRPFGNVPFFEEVCEAMSVVTAAGYCHSAIASGVFTTEPFMTACLWIAMHSRVKALTEKISIHYAASPFRRRTSSISS